MKVKPVLGENGKLLKKVFDVLTSLSMCISGSHSSNLRLTSYETLIPNNHSIWMRKGSCGWAFALLVFDLILSIFAGPFYALDASLSCIYLYELFLLFLHLILLLYFCFCVCKNPKTHKTWKVQKFNRICLSTYEFGLVPSYYWCSAFSSLVCYVCTFIFVGKSWHLCVTVVNQSSSLSWIISQWSWWFWYMHRLEPIYLPTPLCFCFITQ